jgi:hypothetical protein
MVSRSRRQSRRQSRRNRNRSRRQRGGGGCSARYNRNSFSQKGGFAPYSTGDATLLDRAGMISAQSWAPVEAVNSLANVIPKQMGGMQGFADAYAPPLMAGVSRMQSGASRRRRRQRGGMAGLTRMQSGSSRRRRNRRQRGGFAPLEAPSLLIDSAARAMSGVNNQFSNESMVNSMYNESRGPQ